jgi:hypothetical protein
MTKREKVYLKYNGKCAYTGHDLDEKWQIDHMHCKSQHYTYQGDINHIDNLIPALNIVNHYKRGMTVEQFRRYMLGFHIRLAKLPKNTSVEKTKKRKEYMYKVANAFDITIDKPFSGKFYFEKDLVVSE